MAACSLIELAVILHCWHRSASVPPVTKLNDPIVACPSRTENSSAKGRIDQIADRDRHGSDIRIAIDQTEELPSTTVEVPAVAPLPPSHSPSRRCYWR